MGEASRPVGAGCEAAASGIFAAREPLLRGKIGAPRREIVLASTNPHKLEELRAVLPGWKVAELECGDYPPETGSSYVENARTKAAFGRRHAPSRAWVIGEDSGIEADGLDGRPGIHSARWAGDGVTRMLAELDGVSPRSARYICTTVALGPDGEELEARGSLEGTIAREPRGEEGFGYDPIFVPEGESATVAELGNDWKRVYSHRAKALAALVEALERLAGWRKTGIRWRGFRSREDP